MKITKHKDGDDWQIAVDGRRIDIWIMKGLPPHYREPQMYDAVTDRERCDYLFEAKSLHAAVLTIDTILRLAS